MNNPGGYYVIGSYTSVAWYLILSEAIAEAKRMNYRGGTHYTVEEAKAGK